MGNPVAKESACLGVAASVKAGPNLLVKKQGRFCSLRKEEIFYSESYLLIYAASLVPPGSFESEEEIFMGQLIDLYIEFY
jgi:hypothetical protein